MKNEKGILKNLGNFETLIAFCRSYKEKYNPGNPMLELNNLEATYQSAKQMVEAEIKAKKAFQDAINYRSAEFDGIETLSGRIINAMISSGISRAKLNDANEHHRKLNGRRALATKNDPDKKDSSGQGDQDDNKHSVSQLGFDNKIGHFKKLIETVKTEPLYLPNEDGLKLAGLEEKLQAMEEANKEAKAYKSVWAQALIERNDAFNNNSKGLNHIAKLVKAHVKSVFLPRSSQSKQLSVLQFDNI